MEGSKSYADYLINRNSLIGHPAMMPATAHAPVNPSNIQSGAPIGSVKTDRLVEKHIAQSRARVASMNTCIRPVVLKEIEKEIREDNQIATS